eukprot:jgi/Picre1/34558/NNA_002026.t1
MPRRFLSVVVAALLVVLLIQTHQAASLKEDPSINMKALDKHTSKDLVRLEICDCEEATGDPQGLSCSKEGYFVASFEREGQWAMGGEPVPLSKAVCCRPCLPEDKITVEKGQLEWPSDAVAVVSVGCHPSSNTESAFQCERDARGKSKSFIVGFTNIGRVFAPGEPAYYPLDASECCIPSLLMDTGHTVPIEACDCTNKDDAEFRISCGGKQTDRLLTGYDSFRIAPNGHNVPVGDASCCGMCVRNVTDPSPVDCSSLDNCNGRGSCILGRCECHKGWAGANCGIRSGDTGDIPGWAIVLIVIGSSLLGVIILGLLAYVAELILDWREDQHDGDDEDGDSQTQPLLIRIDRDDDGSVGSQDTESSEDSDIEERIHTAEQELNQESDQESIEEEEGEEPNAEDLEEQSTSAPTAAAGLTAMEHQQEEETHDQREPEIIDTEIVKKKLRAGTGPLAEVICNVCMDRPVQTVVVPCGHACMCRRCCRRLHRCPLCRTVIARRQKLYV